MCVLHQIDQVKAEKFAEDLIEVLNHSALSYMISLGHKTNLFDTMNDMDPATSEEIAEKAGLNERYVREWLHALACAKIIHILPEGPLYYLPAEHTAFLTRAAGSDNMAPFFQYFSVMGSVEDKIADCFRNGGGIGYEHFPSFHQVMAEDSGLTVLSSLFDHILPLIPGIEKKLESGIRVLDLACGSGKAVNLMGKTFPNSQFTGIDLSTEAIERASKEAQDAGLTNVTFIQADLTHYKPESKFDLITTFDGVHDQARPDILLKTIYDSLNTNGYYLMQDIDASSKIEQNLDHPVGTLLYTISSMHCMTVSLAQGGMGLGTMWGIEKAREMLHEAGFTKIKLNRLEHDFQNYYMVIQK